MRPFRIAGIVVNRHDAQSAEKVAWLRDISTAAESLEIPVTNPLIPKRVVPKKSTESTVGVDEHGSRSAPEVDAIYKMQLESILNEGAQK